MGEVTGIRVHLNEMLSLNLRPAGIDVRPGRKYVFKIPKDGASGYVTGNLRCTLDFSDDSACEGVIRQVETRGNFLWVDLDQEE